jgi:hypothetical protein
MFSSTWRLFGTGLGPALCEYTISVSTLGAIPIWIDLNDCVRNAMLKFDTGREPVLIVYVYIVIKIYSSTKFDVALCRQYVKQLATAMPYFTHTRTM